jgi:glycosyltransferase involved in cell wall biosynthesis
LVRIENWLIRRIDLLITVGEKLRQHFAGRGAARSTVVGNWKRLEEYERSREQNLEVRRKLGIPDDALVVVCITQLLKDRKIEEVLDAVDQSPEVYVIIGGKGILSGYIAERAAKNPRIVQVGFVSAADVPAYTCAGDVVYYGFDPCNPNARFSAPNKLFEALAAGRPLITGDFGEIADVVCEARCGVVLPAYSAAEVRDALNTFLEPGARESMAANAKRHGRTFMNWRKGEDVLHREYSRLLPSGLKLPPDREYDSQTSGATSAAARA